jgi:hypothetical protein
MISVIYAIYSIAAQAINTPARGINDTINEVFSEKALISELQARIKALLASYRGQLSVAINDGAQPRFALPHRQCHDFGIRDIGQHHALHGVAIAAFG